MLSRSSKNKSSAVAKMGDRLDTTDKSGGCCAFFGGGRSWVSSNNVAWAKVYLRTK